MIHDQVLLTRKDTTREITVMSELKMTMILQWRSTGQLGIEEKGRLSHQESLIKTTTMITSMTIGNKTRAIFATETSIVIEADIERCKTGSLRITRISIRKIAINSVTEDICLLINCPRHIITKAILTVNIGLTRQITTICLPVTILEIPEPGTGATRKLAPTIPNLPTKQDDFPISNFRTETKLRSVNTVLKTMVQYL